MILRELVPDTTDGVWLVSIKVPNLIPNLMQEAVTNKYCAQCGVYRAFVLFQYSLFFPTIFFKKIFAGKQVNNNNFEGVK